MRTKGVEPLLSPLLSAGITLIETAQQPIAAQQIPGTAEKTVKIRDGGGVTIKLKFVDLARGLAVIAMGNVPTGVERLVETVNVLEQVGLQELLVKLAVAPDGKPKMVNVTG
jgi:hypothetical protein